MIYKIFFPLFALFILLPSNAFSGPENEKSVEKIKLTIKECIALTLKNNLNIRIEKITPLIAESALSKGEGEFEPALSASLAVRKDRSPSASAFANPKVGELETFSLSAGLSKKYKRGTEATLLARSSRNLTNSSFQGINPEYNTSIKLSVAQSLLKGFGTDVNSAVIQIAAINLNTSRLSFESAVLEILAAVQLTYLDLVFARNDLDVKIEKLHLAKEFEERVKTQVEIGVLPPVEITQAKAEAALREEERIIAESNIQNIEDRLKQFVNISPDLSAYSLIPSETPLMKQDASALEEDIVEALEKRPDYLELLSLSKSLALDLFRKKNMLLPSLTLSGALELTGLSGSAKTITSFDGSTSRSDFGGGYEKSYTDIFTGKYYNWDLGISLTIPLGNSAARSDFRAAELTALKNRTIIRNFQQNIKTQVRAARRKVETALKRIDVTKVSGKLAMEKLAAEETKFKLGMSTSFNVLEFQRDLSLAKTRELLAVSDYNKAIINLDLATGRLLGKNGISLGILAETGY